MRTWEYFVFSILILTGHALARVESWEVGL
jgi:hypothetical protein